MDDDVREPAGPRPERVALTVALEAARDAVDALALPLATPGRDASEATRRATLSRLDDHLLPRSRAEGAPVLVVVGGSTGAGKSTLVSSLVGAPVSAAGVLRPTTLAPVLVHHPDDAAWFGADRVLPHLVRAGADEPVPADAVHRTLRLVATEAVGPGLALLDAPDVDSVVAANRDLAAQLLGAADLWLFVTTAARYADAVPWALLDAAARRRTRLALVLDRVEGAGAGAVAEHLRSMLAEHGLAGTPVVEVPESPLTGGLLGEDALVGLRSWLADVASPAARERVVRETFDGAVDDVVVVLGELGAAAAEQAEASARLKEAVAHAYGRAVDDVSAATADGTMLRGEVLARWQDLVGTGDFVRRLEKGVGRVRDRLGAFVRGRRADAPAAVRAVGHDLEAVVVDAVHAAAERASDAWRADPAGRALTDGLVRGGPALREDAAAAVRGWQGDVLELVRTTGSSKRGTARALSFGVNGLGLALMIVVFASTGGLTGAEVGIAGGTALVAQSLLEAVFGDDAVRRLAVTARERLVARVTDVADADAARFRDRLRDVASTPDGAERLDAAAHRVRDAAAAERRTRPLPPVPEPPAAASETQPVAEARKRAWWRGRRA
ncbi:ABC transporter [Sanguibacter massiliensis]|uniref:ABC transporter n=1 Tax=Sanguibacter massiliensis TaxID=1973217 RepID=UPI00101AE455|nr:ABC transporter [Sanguibacter massiliensis]